MADESRKDTAVDGPVMRHQLRAASETDRADERERLPRAKRPGTDGALAARSPAVLTTHARLAERLVEEDQATLADRFDERAERFAPLAMLRGVALDRDEGLFFREYPRRWSARQTDEPLVCT